MKSTATALALLLMASAANAQFTPFPSPTPFPITPQMPNPASLSSPKGTLQGEAALGTMLTLQWTHHSVTLNQAPQPTHYLICFYNTATHNCSNAPLRWMLPANTISRTVIVRRNIAVGYTYTYAPLPAPIADTELDRKFEWKIGACRTSLESSCTFATAAVAYSTQDLSARNISDASTSTTLFQSGEVENLGTRNSLSFTSELVAWEAVYDSVNDRCLTDVNAVNPGAGDHLLTSTGQQIEISSLPLRSDGTRDVGNHVVAAIYSSLAIPFRATGTNAISGIRPNRTATAVTVTDSNSSVPTAYATRLFADSTQAVAELNENNNAKGECHVIR